MDSRGNVYASSLNAAATAGPANICVLDRSGTLIKTIAVAAGPSGVTRLLGMLYVPGEGLYVGDVANFTGGRVLRVNPETGAATVIATGLGAPNAFARDSHGNLFVRILRWHDHEDRVRRQRKGFAYPAQLARLPGESPPFGANGLAFDRNGAPLCGMTRRDQVFRIAYEGGSLAAIQLFAQGVAGAPWMVPRDRVRRSGNLYVCSNQSEEIAVLSPSGDVIAEYRARGLTPSTAGEPVFADARSSWRTWRCPWRAAED